MTFLIALISIGILAALASLLRSSTPVRACPICVGVSGTWIWMLVARFLGSDMDPIVLAVLMGGSVVGIAYQLDRRVAPSGALFKALFVPAGFAAAFGAASESWGVAVLGLGVAIGVAVSFWLRGPAASASVSPLVADAQKKLEHCCN